jgi:hypothetical protein
MIGQNFDVVTAVRNESKTKVPKYPVVYKNEEGSQWWYRFIDLPSTRDTSGVVREVSRRTISSAANCTEWSVWEGGHAGFKPDNKDSPNRVVLFPFDASNTQLNKTIFVNQVTGSTTWASYNGEIGLCGPRCTEMVALQVADKGVESTPEPRAWYCWNTISEVEGLDDPGLDEPERLQMSNKTARIIAGSIGYNGVQSCAVTGEVRKCFEYENVAYAGDTKLSPFGYNATAKTMEHVIMKFSVGALSAMDSLRGPRINVKGTRSPSAAQVVNVKWKYAAPILAGIPLVQYLMLLGVVYFTRKAIILEPSYITAAHLLRPVLNRLGPDGSLLSVDEMSERLGPDYKFTYGVKPDTNHSGVQDSTTIRPDGPLLSVDEKLGSDYKFTYGVMPDTHVSRVQDSTTIRHVGLIEESDGFGYIRGNMPEGCYD